MGYLVFATRGCATSGITVDSDRRGGNRLQIRDQRPRFTPVAGFDCIRRKLKTVKTKEGPLENSQIFPGNLNKFPKGPPLVFTNFNFLQMHSKPATGVNRGC